jgi:hypothetical protein
MQPNTTRRLGRFGLVAVAAAFAALTGAPGCGQSPSFRSVNHGSDGDGDAGDPNAEGGGGANPNGTTDTGEHAAPSGGPGSDAVADGQARPGENPVVDPGNGGADHVYDHPEDGTRREIFAFGGDATSRLADYLFVIDNSCSMDGIQAKTRAGLASLVGGGTFPAGARIAVMTTMPADPKDLSKPHPDVAGVAANALADDPGFLRLTTAATIAAYRAKAPAGVVARFARKGCDAAWFAPDAKDADGQSCFLGATQTGNTCLNAEAGLTAFGQMLAKTKAAGQTLFRPGAVANVIFVSDTHDPGVDSASLRAMRPTFAKLRATAQAQDGISGFRIHAIAPVQKCSGEEVYDRAYYAAADASGGVKADSCTATDYRPAIAQVAQTGSAPQIPVFALSKTAAKVVSVVVDGKPTTAYALELGGRVVRIDALTSTAKHSIEIVYGVAP